MNNKNVKKRRIILKSKKKFILSIIILISFVGSIFFIYKKFLYKNTVENKSNIKNIASELPKDASTDSRENAATLENENIDLSFNNIYKPDGHKIAYLTFDDGPNINTTPEILKVLDKFNVKATFFIVGQMAKKYPNIVRMEYNDGQVIGNHTYSHNYKYIYSNPKFFIEDVNMCDSVLKSILGNSYNSKLLRFPGGSFGANRKPFRDAITNTGYRYIDWNDLTGDAEARNVPVEKLMTTLMKNTVGKEHVIILMHDGPSKLTTIQALPKVIEYLKSQGYAFNTLK